jgi:HPt (histidine-containing phosphotransfer) domain-containing protein
MEQRVREHLCRVYGLGMDDVRELYEIGCQTVLETLARLEKAQACADMHELGEASHMLKGTLFNMGLTELGELARNLELAAKGARRDEAAVVLTRLGQALAPFASRS